MIRRGVALCRPRIERRGWVYSLHPETAFAGRMNARCAGMRARFADVARLSGFDDFTGFTGASGPARVSGRGTGWVFHRVTESPAG
jgi:hypothetical protein